MKRDPEIALVTGVANRVLARRLLSRWLEQNGTREARVLAEGLDDRGVDKLLASFPAKARARIRVLDGKAASMDLGLSGAEFTALAEEVTLIVHAGTNSRPGIDEDSAKRVNRESTREIIELASNAKSLSRIVLVSSVTVSGLRSGYVLEDELDLEAPPRNHAEKTLRAAERLLRRTKFPLVVLRPGLLVGDSKTGETDEDDSLLELVRFMLDEPPEMRLPIPVRGDVPVHLLPVDFAAEACAHLIEDERAVGKTLHVVDPDPLNAERVLELLARAVGRRFPRSILPTSLTSLLLRAPMGRVVPWPTAFLDQLATEVVYDDHNARALLAGSGLECPALETYVRAVVRAARDSEDDRGTAAR